MSSRCHNHAKRLGYSPKVVAGQGRQEYGRQLKCIDKRIGAYQATAAQKAHIEGNTMTNNRIITNEKLQVPGNGFKMRSTYQLLRCYTGETLHAIGNRTPRSNECLHRIEYGVPLELDGRNLKNRVLFCMQPCCFQVKCYPNRRLLRHTFNFLISRDTLANF